MRAETWHTSDALLREYAGGGATVAGAASVEAHLLECGACRRRVADTQALSLVPVWSRVAERIQAPPVPRSVLVLERLGLREDDGVVIAAIRALGGAWTLCSLAVVAFAALAAIPSVEHGRALYLLLAPLVPVLSVVAAFRAADPLAELTGSAPYSSARLALLRTATVVVTSVPFAVAIGAAVPGIAWLAFAWLLPALALTVATLLAMTWWRPETAGAISSCAWIATLAIATRHHRVADVLQAQSQLVFLAIAALAAAALALRLSAARTPGGYA
jgi:hypothetical protein